MAQSLRILNGKIKVHLIHLMNVREVYVANYR